MVILTPIEDQASSSSASTHQSKSRYDVFLSFRGEDTRFTFTGNLCKALVLKGINTFMDDRELKIGDPLSPSLIKAIEESKISIVVLSENYASSTWCLEELCKILECMEKNNQLVWPIFYKVTPSDVRHQRNGYGKAMAEHEERFINETEKVVKWKSALSQVAFLKGWEWHPRTEYEYQFIPKIVETVVTKLHRKLLDISENVIGNQSCLKKVKSLLDIESNNNVCMLGIHGIGGIGKTTLAEGLYNLIVDSFECAAFLGSVRERSIGYKKLLKLQEQLLSHLLKEEDIKFCSVDEGAINIKNSLKNRKVLLVLDDVDKLEQLEKLAGGCDWFGSGSRIVITTRDKYLLDAHKVEKSYKMKLLNDHDALQLFCWNAFKISQPTKGYEDVSNRAVEYANGLPLALKVIGCNLIGKSVQDFECALEQYERIPDRKIHDILRVSYDCLEENAKSIFLDIACFFKGKELKYVEKILAACDFGPKYNIGVLVDKSLTTIEAGLLKMHDLIQDMGKEIVRQEAPSRPGKRSRLYCQEDVIRVLSENSGSSNIEGIVLDPLEGEEVEWSGAAFEKMNNLRILIIRNVHFPVGPNYLPNNLRVLEWKQYPSKSLPSNFKPRKLVDLSLPDSPVLEKPFLQKQKHLAYMNLSNCKSITHVPDLSGVPSLRELKLDRCDNLIEIHEFVEILKYLNYLSASECANLTIFSPRMLLPSLGFLNLHGCKKLQHFPEIVGEMKSPLSLFLKDTGIEKLPHSIGNLTGLHLLQMGFSTSLRTMLCIEGSDQAQESFTRFQSMELPATRYSNLQKLYIRRGGLLDEDLHVILKFSPNLETLELPENDFVSIPACIKEFVYLKTLNVSECLKLQEIPELPLSIEEVEARYCPSLTSETTSMLWSQAFKEVDKLRVMMPQSNIPDWFDHRCEGDTLRFWARQEFPIFAVAFVFRKKNPNLAILAHYNEGSMLQFYINGHRQGLHYHVSLIDDDQVLLCDIRKIPRPRRRELDKALKHGWILVEIKCDESENFAISECGAYVYKKTNMGHIRFNSPNQDVSTTYKGILVYFLVLVIAVICSFIKENIA